MPTALKPFVSAAALAGVALFSASAVHAQTVITADPANTAIGGYLSSPSYVSTPGLSEYYLGSVYQQNGDDAIVLPFQLPTNSLITAATFTAQLTGRNGTPTFNVNVDGLSRTSALPTVLLADYNSVPTFTDPNLFTTADGYAQHSDSSTSLLAYLNAQELTAPGQFVFLRLSSSSSAATPDVSANFYTIQTQTAAGNAQAPTLTLTTQAVVPAPEPSPLTALAVGVLGLGALTASARKRRPLIG